MGIEEVEFQANDMVNTFDEFIEEIFPNLEKDKLVQIQRSTEHQLGPEKKCCIT